MKAENAINSYWLLWRTATSCRSPPCPFTATQAFKIVLEKRHLTGNAPEAPLHMSGSYISAGKYCRSVGGRKSLGYCPKDLFEQFRRCQKFLPVTCTFNIWFGDAEQHFETFSQSSSDISSHWNMTAQEAAAHTLLEQFRKKRSQVSQEISWR